jgi:DNA-binding transcriptional LysR family regulator
LIHYENLEFRHLEYIVAVAEEKTFTAGAQKLRKGQSNVSRQIAVLEQDLGIKIFERDRNGVSLTHVGEELLVFARKMLQMRKEVIDLLRAVHQADFKPFRLGFSPFIARHIVDTVYEMYRDLFPVGSIQAESGDSDKLLEHLEEGRLDAALITLPRISNGFSEQRIMHEHLVVCMRDDDPLAQHEEVPPAALNAMLGIFSDPRHHPRAHERLMEMLDEQGIKPKFSNPNFNSEQVQWMVRTRFCLALISASEVVEEGLTTRPIRGVRWTIDSALVYCTDHKQLALPLLLRDLERKFPAGSPVSQKKPARSVTEAEVQGELPFRGNRATSGGHS